MHNKYVYMIKVQCSGVCVGDKYSVYNLSLSYCNLSVAHSASLLSSLH